MSEPQFTPGPWRETTETTAVEICTIHCCSPRSVPEPEAQRWVYIVSDGSTHRSESEQDANARLIAAAPELYAALADLVDEIETDGGVDTSAWPLLDDAKAALMKARGES